VISIACGAQVQRPVALEEDADGAVRRAAHTVGVLGATGSLAGDERAGDVVQLVGERQYRARGRERRLVSGTARPVVLGDGVGHASLSCARRA
jgi:hypothetical protein